MTNFNFYNFILIIIILDFANNCLFDNMFWVVEIIISTKKITLIDYKKKKKNYPNIVSINHC